jgi:hypothetical protein
VVVLITIVLLSCVLVPRPSIQTNVCAGATRAGLLKHATFKATMCERAGGSGV